MTAVMWGSADSLSERPAAKTSMFTLLIGAGINYKSYRLWFIVRNTTKNTNSVFFNTRYKTLTGPAGMFAF